MMALTVRVFLGPLLGVLLAAQPFSAAQSQADKKDLPSLDSLKAARFESANQPDRSPTVSYSDLQEVITASKACVRGLNVLRRYHDPILTRGVTGISVFKSVSPSVVLVLTGNFKGDEVSEVGLGTGVIVDAAGYVLTNWHVIAGYQAAVIFLKPEAGTDISRQNGYGAAAVAWDASTDLALLRMVKPPVGLRPIRMGDIGAVQVAEDIHVIGHPHGNLWSYSTGVIGQIRDPYAWTYSDGSHHRAKVLQMQTAINPGNSGGPVVDDNGNLLGLVAMSEEGQNLNYAVAVDVITVFVSRSLASRTRGGAAEGADQRAELSSAHLTDGRVVVKATYRDLSAYEVRDTNSRAVGLVAQASDGTLLRATNPNEFGAFREWTVQLPDGKLVKATGQGNVPETISLE